MFSIMGLQRWIVAILVVGLSSELSFVVPQEQGSWYGSGDDGASGDDDEGSAVVVDPMGTPCKQQQLAANMGSPNIGAFRPECTLDGEFKPMQCHTSAGRCWCVDKDGQEIQGSMQVAPKKPVCGRNPPPVINVPTRVPPGAQPPDQDHRSTAPTDGDIIIDDFSTPRPFESPRTTRRKSIESHTTTSFVVDHSPSNDGVDVQKASPFAFMFKDPLILAGIIGGAVLALLCIVLLIMFTIYRMRKKDEGSYALDEPKKSYGFAYKRAKDQEFFA